MNYFLQNGDYRLYDKVLTGTLRKWIKVILDTFDGLMVLILFDVLW